MVRRWHVCVTCYKLPTHSTHTCIFTRILTRIFTRIHAGELAQVLAHT